MENIINQENSFVNKLAILLFVCSYISSISAEPPTSLSFILDNDILVPGNRDQDYTGGLSFTYSINQAQSFPLIMREPLRSLDDFFNIPQETSNAYTIEAGVYGFTPENTENGIPSSLDRPYASLTYFSNSHERVNFKDNSATQSVLTVGFLGLDIFPELQDEVHSITGSHQPRGWKYQISDGGELTARYQISKQKAVETSHPNIQVKTSQHFSVGYITEASYGINARFGRFNSNWWSFHPEQSAYLEQRSSEAGHTNERFFFSGLAVKARAYNAFLQGQFRDSEITYEHDQLNHLLVEMWLGYTHSFTNGYQISYILRAQSSEIKHGAGDRNLIWGGILFSKTWY